MHSKGNERILEKTETKHYIIEVKCIRAQREIEKKSLKPFNMNIYNIAVAKKKNDTNRSWPY